MRDPRFAVAMDFVAGWEGWVSNDPDDRGGLTLAGITQETYDRARKHWKLTLRPVTQSTASERERIYEEMYWRWGKCPALRAPLDLVYFDTLVQHARAPWLLQEALGVTQDGKVGPQTLAAADRADPVAVSHNLIWARLRYYAHIASNEGRNDPEKVFLPGWVNRMVALYRLVGGEYVATYTRRVA